MTDLLITSCSKRKKALDNSPAIEVYDGPVYRILRKRKPEDLIIKILSAKYGLMNSGDLISNYDRIMTFARAAELENEVSETIYELVSGKEFGKIFINLGMPYIFVLDKRVLDLLDESCTQFAFGTIGERLHQLSEWLKRREIGI